MDIHRNFSNKRMKLMVFPIRIFNFPLSKTKLRQKKITVDPLIFIFDGWKPSLPIKRDKVS